MANPQYFLVESFAIPIEPHTMNRQQNAFAADANGYLYYMMMARSGEQIWCRIYRYTPNDNAYTFRAAFPMASGADDGGVSFTSASWDWDANKEVLYITYVYELTPGVYQIRRIQYFAEANIFANDVLISTNATYESAPVIALDDDDYEHIVWSYTGRKYYYYENISSPATVTLIRTALEGTLPLNITIAYNGTANDQLCIYCNDVTAGLVQAPVFYLFAPGADPFNPTGSPPSAVDINIANAVLCVDESGANFHTLGYRAGTPGYLAQGMINRATSGITYTNLVGWGEEQSYDLAIRTGGDYGFRHYDNATDDQIDIYKIGTGVDTVVNNGQYGIYDTCDINTLKLPLPATGVNTAFLAVAWADYAFQLGATLYIWHSDDVQGPIVITPEVLEGSTRNNRIFVCNLDTNAWSIFTKNFMCADIFKGGNNYGDFYAGSVKDGHIYQRDSSYQDDDAGVKVDIDAFWRSKLFQWDGNARFRKMVLDAMGSGQVRFNWQVDRTGASGSVEIFLEPEEDTRWNENTWGLLDPPTYVGLVDGALDDLAVYYYKYLLSKPNYPGLPRYFTSPSYCSLKMTTGEVANNDAGLEIQIPAYADAVAVTPAYTTIDILRTHGGGTTFYWHPTEVTGWDGTAVNYTDTTADTSLTEEFTIEVPDELVWGAGEKSAYTFKEWLKKSAVGNQFQFSFDATGRDDALKIISVKLYWQPKTLH